MELELIKKKIHTIRGIQVMIDRDLAEFYNVETKALNQAVKRNSERFPLEFLFQLNQKEKDKLVTNCDHLNSLKFSPNLPYAFTEQGVAMLSAVLHSKIAIEVSIKIINAFVQMRRFLKENQNTFKRLSIIETKLLEHDNNFDKIFDLMQNNIPKQGIFFDGQIFDSYKFVCDLNQIS
jgi:hypothetical protein